MSNYPNSIDDSTTLPPASGDDAVSVNAAIGAIEAIENELGLVPSGVYADVRTRLDILEARINNPFAPAPDVLNPFFIGNTGVTVQAGFGDPNLALAIPPPKTGSLFLREDGYQNVYVFRPDGYWHDIDSASFAAPIIVTTKIITGNYVFDTPLPDYVIFCNGTAPIIINLPSATTGRQIIIKDISGNAAANPITLSPVAGATIDGSSSFVIQSNRASLTLTAASNSNWYIL